ncbi:L,D-transpeptidase family protein [Aestuariicoccus sp. MJ-SS9]|uniref:L,D-transpeptidase family protein n=1 Tax=Aestuariicoccus sp. MJ-SS9 TaxID=3079855 RepID=UPI00291164EE|nr:L,D-transpeptidase family protein [Aestuariicoccus sp. MJ-SS9]MDU8911604.1 L,D-transpeptidase family protein [Aestuariicoccus sp. MJ-SS9]
MAGPLSLLRRIVLAALTLVCAFLMALAAAAQEDGADPPRSAFQRLLDRNAIPYRVPPVGKAILVNIPAFELVTFQDGTPVFRSKVIVGTPWNRTPRLRTYTTAVRFRPTWRPTPSMIASGEYRDRVWPAGPSNPLGLAAVRMQPGLLVYMHDTNHRELFEREERALSHGCIRVHRWDDLVAWVLDMPLAEVHAHANGTRTFDAPAPPIPVRLGYFTLFPDADGQIVQHGDIYNLGRFGEAAPKPGSEVIAKASLDQPLSCGSSGG